jgi:uncharacterized protein
MLNLNLSEIARGEQHVRGEVPPDHRIWDGADLTLKEPLSVDLVARSVGEGVFVRGAIRGRMEMPCRRCLAPAEWEIDAPVELLFETVADEERAALEGEVYPLPSRGDTVDLMEPLREQVLLAVPRYLVCREACRGLCPSCGADLNETGCECVAGEEGGPWDALKKLKFD